MRVQVGDVIKLQQVIYL